jgi:hypothetical protein
MCYREKHDTHYLVLLFSYYASLGRVATFYIHDREVPIDRQSVLWVDCRGKGYVNGLCHFSPSHAHSSDAGNEKKNHYRIRYNKFLSCDWVSSRVSYRKRHCCV